jgi:hypothetical protein
VGIVGETDFTSMLARSILGQPAPDEKHHHK